MAEVTTRSPSPAPIALIDADLTVHAETITVGAGSSISTTGDVTLAASASRSGGTGSLPSAQVIVYGAIASTAGIVRVTAAADDEWIVTGATLTADTTYTVGTTAVAEISGAAAVVSAAGLVVTAASSVHFSWDGTAPSVDAGSPADPDGIEGAVRVVLTTFTHAGLTGGARAIVGSASLAEDPTRSMLVAATDDIDIDIAIDDTTVYGAVDPNVIAVFMEFGRLLATTDVSRDTMAYVDGTPSTVDPSCAAAAHTVCATGAGRISAHNTGTVDTAIDSIIVGKVVNTVTKDDAIASVDHALIAAAGLIVEAVTDTQLTASGKIARNDLTGVTNAGVSASSVRTNGGDVTVSAHDATVLTAEAGNLLYEPTTRLVTLASAEARNDLDRTVSATVETATVALGAGDLTVQALADGRLLAQTGALAVKYKTGIIPTAERQGARCHARGKRRARRGRGADRRQHGHSPRRFRDCDQRRVHRCGE